jgi:hypothetical protein
VLAQYDRLLGLDLATVVVDGWLTKAPRGGEKAGTSPVDRGQAGLNRSLVTDASGVPVALDRGYASRRTRATLADQGCIGHIAH